MRTITFIENGKTRRPLSTTVLNKEKAFQEREAKVNLFFCFFQFLVFHRKTFAAYFPRAKLEL